MAEIDYDAELLWLAPVPYMPAFPRLITPDIPVLPSYVCGTGLEVSP